MASEVKWIKLSTGLPDNKKIKQIRKLPNGDSIALLWVFLMCLAGDTNDQGLVYFTSEIPYTDEMLADQFDMDVNTIRLALTTFQKFGMIQIIDEMIMLSSWEKWQAVRSLESMREQTRQRVARHREKQKQLSCNVTCSVTDRYGNAIDKDIERDIDRDIRESSTPAPEKCIQDASRMETPANNDKPSRQKFGEYGWVLLTDQEHQKLVRELGQAEADRCIAYVDELAQQTGNKNKWKDWNLVIRKAAREGWGLGKRIVDQNPAPKRETSYDLNEIDRLLSKPGNYYGG